MTRCIAKSVKQKNKLYKKYLQYPKGKNEKIYKKYKNKLNHVIKVAKKKYYKEQLQFAFCLVSGNKLKISKKIANLTDSIYLMDGSSMIW
jgi:hypothetical protein